MSRGTYPKTCSGSRQDFRTVLGKIEILDKCGYTQHGVKTGAGGFPIGSKSATRVYVSRPFFPNPVPETPYPDTSIEPLRAHPERRSAMIHGRISHSQPELTEPDSADVKRKPLHPRQQNVSNRALIDTPDRDLNPVFAIDE